MSDAPDATQGLDLDVNHVARPGPFVAVNRHGRSIQAEASQPDRDRRARDPQRVANRPRGKTMLFAQPLDQRHRPRRGLMRRGTRPRRRVRGAGGGGRGGPTHPLRDRPLTHACARCRGRITPALKEDPAHEQETRRRRTLRITMKLHPGHLSGRTVVWQHHSFQSAPDEQRV